jgi:hypothetical protein
MLIEIEDHKETSFILEMKIDGDAVGATPTMRFSIVSENFSLCIPAELVENGVYEIRCPRLKGILPPGEYSVNAEVFIDDRHFVPLTDTIRIKEEVKPVVTMPKAPPKKPVTEARIAINIKAPEPARAPTPPPVAAAPVRPTLTKTEQVVIL